MATGSGPSHLVKDRGAVVASEEHITGNSKTEGKTMEAAATSSIKCRDPGILVKPFFVPSSSSSWICPSSSTRLLASWIWRCGADGRQSEPLKKRGIDRDDGDRATTNGVWSAPRRGFRPSVPRRRGLLVPRRRRLHVTLIPRGRRRHGSMSTATADPRL
uniref:Uncharacterized protein n=1 Tax=Oryza sativa subsp. japonica TaxID=39947 RepID=Q852J4_ORYSJ|nr:hypothetical protein [Oryza sativa Japonica Group]